MRNVRVTAKTPKIDLNAMRTEASNLIIKRSGMTVKRIQELAVREFVANNIDLLTADERKKYKQVII